MIVMGAFADIQSGVGMIVVGLASVIIGGGGGDIRSPYNLGATFAVV
ncbi:hypothetical protein [Paenibacillus alvei]|nr:hypothetical protein [Paenibacillus alvei]MCY9583496.1 hypothetical protein [Paenibacillus alvei]